MDGVVNMIVEAFCFTFVYGLGVGIMFGSWWNGHNRKWWELPLILIWPISLVITIICEVGEDWKT